MGERAAHPHDLPVQVQLVDVLLRRIRELVHLPAEIQRSVLQLGVRLAKLERAEPEAQDRDVAARAQEPTNMLRLCD